MAVVGVEQSAKGRREGRKGPVKTAKVTVTVPADLVEAATARVKSGRAPSLSAYVSGALAARLAVDEERDAFLVFLDRLDEELGAPSDEEYAWARQFASR